MEDLVYTRLDNTPLGAQFFAFDPARDVQEVVSGLTVDLTEALETGIVRDSGAPTDSNGIEDPGAILGRVENIFDALESQRAIRKYGKKAPLEMTPSDPTPVSNPSSSQSPTGSVSGDGN